MADRNLPELLRAAERRVNAHIWPQAGVDSHLASIPANPDTDVDLLLIEAADCIVALAAENAEQARCLDGGVNCAQERIAAKARIAALEAALRDLMPSLSECDCIYSDRLDPPCPCRAARAVIAYEAWETEAHKL